MVSKSYKRVGADKFEKVLKFCITLDNRKVKSGRTHREMCEK